MIALTGVIAASCSNAGTHATGSSASPSPTQHSVEAVSPDDPTAIEAARAFLDRFMRPDGRVVRTDQGGDTVSEGQAYAMLLAVAAGDAKRFARAWSWTRAHLRRPDALLSWHWVNGSVADPMSAADADVDTAWALALASKRFAGASYLTDARAIMRSVASEETVRYQGLPLLVAGPWARANPATVNPSYLAPPAFDAIARITGDTSISALGAAATKALATLTSTSPHLPPDWAKVSGGTIRPAGSPDGSSGAQYGWDAVRVPLWMSASCASADRAIAAGSWPFLRRGLGGTLDAVYMVSGSPVASYPSAESLVAAAAVARAAGARDATMTLLAKAESLNEASPRYYASALIALGRVLLTTHLLETC